MSKKLQFRFQIFSQVHVCSFHHLDTIAYYNNNQSYNYRCYYFNPPDSSRRNLNTVSSSF